MEIDHLFIFSSNHGQEVDELVEFGLTEGSGRTHPGLGTVNKRLFFENFYLEILWVANELEAKSVKSLGIWDRSNFKNNNYSPFGLCLVDTADTNPLFKDALKFQPDYYPKGMQIEIMTNENKPQLPWIFKLPLDRPKIKFNEPTNHHIGIKRLTKTVFNLNTTEFSESIETIERNSTIEFKQSSKNLLTLEFDNGIRGKAKVFEKLNLEIKY